MSRAIDADALEKEGWSLHRTIRVDMNTEEYQTKPLKQVPTIEPRCETCEAFNKTRLLIPQPEQRWIRCDKELPEEYGEYRITWTTSYASKKRFIGDSEYEVTGEWDVEHGRFKGEWLLPDYIKNYPDVKVLAWKPIEEPYREDGGE